MILLPIVIFFSNNSLDNPFVMSVDVVLAVYATTQVACYYFPSYFQFSKFHITQMNRIYAPRDRDKMNSSYKKCNKHTL